MLQGINLEIEMLAQKIGYIDAVINIFEKNNLDLEDIKEIVDENILEKLKVEFVKKNFFKNKKINSIEDIFK